MQRASRWMGFVAAVAVAAAGACRGSSGDDDGDDNDGGDGTPDGGGTMTIYDVQDDSTPEGTPVTLTNVVVTAIDTYGGRVGGLYVQEQAGGPFSAVLVFGANVDGLAPGDIVTITGGVKDEFPDSAMPEQRITEVAPPDGGSITVMKTGSGAVPAPAVVDPVVYATDKAEAEKWEHVLIKMDNVAVVSPPEPFDDMDPTAETMEVTGPVPVSSNFTDLDAMVGDCYQSITGIGDGIFFYKLLPRSASDLVGGGTMCPNENDVATCTDMMDNDHDGFTDCADFSCQNVKGVDCQEETSIVNIQNGMVAPGTQVKLTDVVVTAKAKFKFDGSTDVEHRVWVQDAATGAPYNGILVFKATIVGKSIDDLAVGDIVDVEGGVSEFFNLTEIAGPTMSPPTITFKAAGPAPTPVTLPLATLLDPAMNEQYEGVLVKIDNVKVVNADAGFGEYTVGAMGAELRIANAILAKPMGLAVDQCIASIVGPLDFTFSNFKIQTRDINLAGGVCP